jgi:hypothetical protein
MKRMLSLGARLCRQALCLSAGLFAALWLSAPCLADLIEMTNGDQYNGAVLAVSLTNVTVRSEVQGTISLPRPKVSRITFVPIAGAAGATAVSGPSAALARTAAPRDPTAQLQPKGADTNFVARMQSELLSQAGPEASRKYSELARGLLSGSLSVNDLRKQAQQTIRDAEAMKQDLGPEASEMLDGYLEILRKFISEPASSAEKP